MVGLNCFIQLKSIIKVQLTNSNCYEVVSSALHLPRVSIWRLRHEQKTSKEMQLGNLELDAGKQTESQPPSGLISVASSPLLSENSLFCLSKLSASLTSSLDLPGSPTILAFIYLTFRFWLSLLGFVSAEKAPVPKMTAVSDIDIKAWVRWVGGIFIFCPLGWFYGYVWRQ